MARHLGDHKDGNEAEQQRARLRLIASPVIGEKTLDSEGSSLAQQQTGPSGPAGVSRLGFRDPANHSCPEFMRHEEATNIELFFDLFFAANLTVFSEVHETTDVNKLTSYIGYFCMLWLTWALVGLFDVRFVTDSVFERVARSCHLGVMIGFAVVAPNFDPDDQKAGTFRAMSLILMVSRLTLAAQYGTIIWHVRKYKATRLPLVVMVVIHSIAALIYLGITFRFRDYNSRVYVVWYIVAIVEMLLNIGLSLWWDVLSFRDTHLLNRMSLLTLIIIGEGIIVISNNVTVIVKNPDAWTPATIGVVVSAVGTLYMVYQIYFDWKRHLHLPPVRQLVWVFLHFPFHLALTLFVEGSSQFILWWKIVEVMEAFYAVLLQPFDPAINDSSFNVTTTWVVNTLNDTVQNIFNEGYSPKYFDTTNDVDEALGKLQTLPNSFWDGPGTAEESATFNESVLELYAAVQNSLFASFNIDGIGEATGGDGGVEFEEDVSKENVARFYLVFVYTFAAAGCVLILLNVLYIVSRYGRDRWGFFNYFRAGVNFFLGFSLALLPLLALNPDVLANYYETPWILPTLLLTFVSVLVLNHLPHPPPILFPRRRGRKSSDSPEDGSGALPTVQYSGGPPNSEGYAAADQAGQAPYQDVVAGYQKNPGQYQNHYVVYQGENESTSNNPSPLSSN